MRSHAILKATALQPERELRPRGGPEGRPYATNSNDIDEKICEIGDAKQLPESLLKLFGEIAEFPPEQFNFLPQRYEFRFNCCHAMAVRIRGWRNFRLRRRSGVSGQ